MQPDSPVIPVLDQLGRPLESLRLSVTDRCNLRCLYCMPEEEYTWLPRAELLTFEELTKLVEVFTAVGVRQVRLTGGEPLVRQDLHRLVEMIAANTRVADMALTTNGVLLAEQAESLRNAGLKRVTVSLDTLRPDRFRSMTRRDDHGKVLAGIYAAGRAGFTGTKLDAVIVRGVNDDELIDLIEFARANAAEVRFIEYMDVAGATQWSMERVVSRAEMLQRLEQRYGKITPAGENATARRPPSASCFPTARFSASSPRPRRPSAAPAIAAASPPMASGIAASTPRRVWTCAARCARALRLRNWLS